MFKMTERRVENAVILDCEGQLTLGEGSRTFREQIRELDLIGFRTVVLNLAEVSYVDASGIAELVSTLTTLSGKHVSLRLFKPNQQLLGLLRFTRLETVFKIFQGATAVYQS